MKKYEGISLPLLVVSFILGLAVVACGGNPTPTAVPTKPPAAPTATAVPAAPAPTAVPTKPAAAPTSTAVPAAPASGPPAIPHGLAGQEKCTLCHQVGAPGAGQPGGTGLPANHQGRTDNICQGCHKPK